ncbi:MAG: acetyl-CoA carboxylase biotin carboxyl carrier protein subunit [Planctomycetota bacterium]
MKYLVRSASGRRFEVEVEPLGEARYRVRLGDREIQAAFRDVDRLGQYAVRLDGRSFAVSIEEFGGTDLGVHLAGESFRMRALDERERAAKRIGGPRKKRSEALAASMPGIIVGVLVQAGDLLRPGQPALVFEAMKMQNEIPAPHGGKVREVLVEEGQAVKAGQVLVRLEAIAVEPPAP